MFDERWTGHSALTKRRSSPSSNRVGQARPFPTSARSPVMAVHKVHGNRAEGLWWQGTRTAEIRHGHRVNMAQGPCRHVMNGCGPRATKLPLCEIEPREQVSLLFQVYFQQLDLEQTQLENRPLKDTRARFLALIMFQVPALKRDLEQGRINQACEIGRLCYERLIRWYGTHKVASPCYESPFR